MTLETIKSLIPVAIRNDTLPALTDVILQWAEQANDEIARLQVELNNYKKASAFCEKHLLTEVPGIIVYYVPERN